MEDLFASLASNQSSQSISPPPAQPADKRKLAAEIDRKTAKAMSRVMAFRQEASTSEKAYDGHQWDDLDRMRLETLRRPTLVFNELKPTINAISGIERLNRPDMRFVSRPLDSATEEDMAGDLASEAYAQVLDLCDGNSERSRAIRDMSITGMGWYTIRMDYELEPDGRIILERCPWREMLWDTAARKENILDSRWRARKRDMPKEEFEHRWPGKLEQISSDAPEYPESSIEKYELVTPFYSLANERANPLVEDSGPTSESISVLQYQWMEPTTVYRFADPSAQGGIREIREEDWGRLKSRFTMLGQQVPFAVKQSRAVYKQVYTAKGLVLEGPVEIPGGFSLKCVTGEWDDDKKVWYGIVRPLLDPQRTMNKSISTALTMFLTNAKGGVMFETGAFVDPESAKNQWSRPDAWIELQEGGAGKIVQREPMKYQGAIDLFFNESKAAMNYVSGIPADMIGTAVGDANAPTIMKRVQAALSVLGWYFDNVSRAQRDEARTVLEYIRMYWTQGQLIRVGGSANSKAIPLLKSNLPVQYDLMLDESVRHNPNLKAQIWQDLQPMIPVLIKSGLGQFLLTALKFSPMPAQLVNELQRQAAEMAKNPNKQQDGKKQDDPREVEARIAKLTADTQLIQAEIQQMQQQQSLKTTNLAIDTYTKVEDLRQQEDQQKHQQLKDLFEVIHAFVGNGDEQIATSKGA